MMPKKEPSFGKEGHVPPCDWRPAQSQIPQELFGRIQDFIANYRTGQIAINFTQGKIANWNVHITERGASFEERAQKPG